MSIIFIVISICLVPLLPETKALEMLEVTKRLSVGLGPFVFFTF